MSNLIQRTLSGAVYVAMIVLTLIYCPGVFCLLMCGITMLAVREMHRLLGSDRWLTAWSMIAGAALYIASWLTSYPPYLPGLFDGLSKGAIAHGLNAIAGLLVIFTLVAELFRKQANPIGNWGNVLVSLFMVAWPLSLMPRMIARAEGGSLFLLMLFVIIWINDTGAYCTGSLLGKHKMFPRVSPGKSWEGLAGGALFAIAGLFGFTALTDVMADAGVCLKIVLALVIVASATLGDLTESLLKRTLGVKDSGNFMPGHGGVLDRFDSVLLATPVIYLLLMC